MTAKTKTQLGITIYSALIGSLVGVVSFAFLAGGRTEKWDTSAAQSSFMYPLVIKHEAILAQKASVSPAPAFIVSQHRYAQLPTLPNTELFIP